MRSLHTSWVIGRALVLCIAALAAIPRVWGAQRSSLGYDELAPPAPVAAKGNDSLVNGSANTTTSNASLEKLSEADLLLQFTNRLESARQLCQNRQHKEAEPILVELLSDPSPDWIKQQALLELATAAREQGELTRAEQIYAQFLTKWPNDLQMPEIILRQGQLFRQMGLNNLALVKFYAVMTSSLVLKNEKQEYYQRLVLVAQTEIAETYYELGKYSEATEFLSRLLKQNNPRLNRALTQFKLVRCLTALGKHDETVSQGLDFLAHYAGAPEQPEVRFHLALALKQLGRSNESLTQVLALLQEQKTNTVTHPELWAYWQQRAGNQIANQLYREGDYTKALEIYLALSRLDLQPEWQLPVSYQIGLTYERLSQPQKARERYLEILQREREVGPNVAPALKTVFEMAKWRVEFLGWREKAELDNRRPGALQSRVAPASVLATMPIFALL